MQESGIRSLGQEDPLEKGMATLSTALAWRIPWTEEPGGLQSMESQSVGHDWLTSLSLFTFQYSIVYMYHIFLIHSSVNGYLGYLMSQVGFSKHDIKCVNGVMCSPLGVHKHFLWKAVWGWSRGWRKWGGTQQPMSGCPSILEKTTVCSGGPALLPPSSTDSSPWCLGMIRKCCPLPLDRPHSRETLWSSLSQWAASSWSPEAGVRRFRDPVWATESLMQNLCLNFQGWETAFLPSCWEGGVMLGLPVGMCLSHVQPEFKFLARPPLDFSLTHAQSTEMLFFPFGFSQMVFITIATERVITHTHLGPRQRARNGMKMRTGCKFFLRTLSTSGGTAVFSCRSRSIASSICPGSGYSQGLDFVASWDQLPWAGLTMAGFFFQSPQFASLVGKLWIRALRGVSLCSSSVCHERHKAETSLSI